MIDLNLSLSSSGAVRMSGCENRLRLGYSRNKGIYRLNIAPTGEWKEMTIRALWRTEKGKVFSTLVEDGKAEVPACITSEPGEGRLTFEGSDGVRILTSADVQYSVAANSGGKPEDMPMPDTPAWEALLNTMQGQMERGVAAAIENTVGLSIQDGKICVTYEREDEDADN